MLILTLVLTVVIVNQAKGALFLSWIFTLAGFNDKIIIHNDTKEVTN